MECQGTVKPHGVTTEVTFDFGRRKAWHAWNRPEGGGWTQIEDIDPWMNDDLTELDEDKTPSASDHIYQIDGPGLPSKDRTPDYTEDFLDLREAAYVLFEGETTPRQCSNFYKWHSQIYTMPKAGTAWRTRSGAALQKLGEGWISIPDNP